jgi:hypothetical protein
MAIAKKPESKQTITESNRLTAEQQAFISGAEESPNQSPRKKSVPVMLRVDPDVLDRIDRAAKRVGLKRAAFILSSAVERVGRMERD